MGPLEIQFANAVNAHAAIDFARKYAMFPANSAKGYGDPILTKVTNLEGAFSGFRHTKVSVTGGKARVELQEVETQRGKAVRVVPTLMRQGATDGFPAYFLAWDPTGGTVELTLPNRNPDLPEEQHPRFFFTAALSGCSVIFTGGQENPTIYHCGVSEHGAPSFKNAAAFWRHMILLCQRTGISGAQGEITSVDKTQYMDPKIVKGKLKKQLSPEMVDELERRYEGRIVAENWARWGMVFGVRPKGGRRWEFYLQKNYQISFSLWEDFEEEFIEHKKVLGIFTKKIKKTKTSQAWRRKPTESFPEVVQKIYPGVGQTPPMTSGTDFVA